MYIQGFIVPVPEGSKDDYKRVVFGGFKPIVTLEA